MLSDIKFNYVIYWSTGIVDVVKKFRNDYDCTHNHIWDWPMWHEEFDSNIYTAERFAHYRRGQLDTTNRECYLANIEGDRWLIYGYMCSPSVDMD